MIIRLIFSDEKRIMYITGFSKKHMDEGDGVLITYRLK